MMLLKYGVSICFAGLLILTRSSAFASSRELDRAAHSIAEQLTQEIKTPNESIAIPPFLTLENKTTVLGKMLSEKLISQFSKPYSPLEKGVARSDGVLGEEAGEGRGVLTPVERDFIFKLTDEMKLGMTGLVEPRTVQQVGKFSGASYVLVGTIQKVGKDVRVNSRLIRTETSKIEKSVETTLKGTPEILDLLSQEIKTPLIPTPEEDGKMKLIRTDFDKLRKDYEQLQDELEKLKDQLAQAKDEKSKIEVSQKQKKTQQELSANEYIAKGNVAYQLKDYNSAVENYNRAIELSPKDAEAYNKRGNAYGEMGDNVRAISDFNRAIELDPKLAVAYYNRGLAYGNMGDNVRAISDFNRAIEIDPKYAEAYSNRGVAYYNNGQVSAAKREFQKACDLGLDTAVMHWMN